MIDVLIVVDNRDEIKQCVHRITSTLQTVKPKPRIKTVSIYDLDNKKSNLQCRKVLFMLTEATKSLRLRVKPWVDELPRIKGNKDKYFVIKVNDNTSTDIAEEESQIKYIDKNNILSVTNLKDIFTWWSSVLKFIFVNNGKRVSNRKANYFLKPTTDPVWRMVDMFDKIDKFLEDFGAQKRNENQCKCGLVFMKHRDFDTASTITNPGNTELDDTANTITNPRNTELDDTANTITNPRNAEFYRIKNLIMAQNERRNKECVYIMTDSSAPIPDTIQELTRLAHNKLQIMRCLLWMLVDLQLITARKYDPQLGNLDSPIRPLYQRALSLSHTRVLVIRRIVAVLIFLCNLPVFIIDISFIYTLPALLDRIKYSNFDGYTCAVAMNITYAFVSLSSLWILFIDTHIDSLPLNFELGIFIYILPPLYFIGWLTIVHYILEKYYYFKCGVYSIPAKLW